MLFSWYCRRKKIVWRERHVWRCTNHLSRDEWPLLSQHWNFAGSPFAGSPKWVVQFSPVSLCVGVNEHCSNLSAIDAFHSWKSGVPLARWKLHLRLKWIKLYIQLWPKRTVKSLKFLQRSMRSWNWYGAHIWNYFWNWTWL